MTAAPLDGVEQLTGSELTDALVPLVAELVDAVFVGDPDATAAIRERAESWVCAHGAQPADAGWAMAVVATAMIPGGVPPRMLLAWRKVEHRAPTYAPPRPGDMADVVVIPRPPQTYHRA